MVQPGRFRVHRGRQDEGACPQAQGRKWRGQVAHLRPPERPRRVLRAPAARMPLRPVREALRGRVLDRRRGVRREQVVGIPQGHRRLHEKAQGTERAQAGGLRGGGRLHGRNAPLRRGRDGRHRRRRAGLQAGARSLAGQLGKHRNVPLVPLRHGEPGPRPAPRHHLRDRRRDGPQLRPEGPLRQGTQAPALRDPQEAQHRVPPARDVPCRVRPALQQRHRDGELRGREKGTSQGPRVARRHKHKRRQVAFRGRREAAYGPPAGHPRAPAQVAHNDQHNRVHLQRPRLHREEREALQGHRNVQALDGRRGSPPRKELETTRRLCGNTRLVEKLRGKSMKLLDNEALIA